METACNCATQPLIYVAPLGAAAPDPTGIPALCRDERQAQQWRQAGWTVVTPAEISAHKGACLDAGQALALEQDPRALLSQLHGLCRSAGLSLRVCVPNASNETLLLHLMSGEGEGGDAPFAQCPSRRLFTHATLERMMGEAGFTCCQAQDVQAQPVAEHNSFLATGSTLYRGLSYYHGLVDSHSQVRLLCRTYRAEEAAAPSAPTPQGDAPFLSIVMRTVGNRVEAMREALLCLAAQDDDSFELLVMVHNPKPGRLEAVQALIEEFPASLREKISVHTVRCNLL